MRTDTLTTIALARDLAVIVFVIVYVLDTL